MRRDQRESSTPVSPWEIEVGGLGDEDHEQIECGEEKESEEAKSPEVLRDPGAPTPKEVEQHNVTHLPFRSWCPHCVSGKAQDRQHKKRENQDEKQIPEIVFDYVFLASAEDDETIPIRVARDWHTHMLFAHAVPRKGMVCHHGADAMEKDIEKLGYKEIILKSDGEPAIKAVQEEVKRRRTDSAERSAGRGRALKSHGSRLAENSRRGEARSYGAGYLKAGGA